MGFGMAVIEVEFPGNLSQVDTANELRDLPSSFIADNALYLVSDLGLYTYDAGSLATDNGTTVLKPDDLSPLQAGRWVLSGANFFAPLAALAASDGSGLVGYRAAGTSITADVGEQLDSLGVDAKVNFGAKGDDATDDTAAMLAFFQHCISTGTRGYIPAGKYRVNWGALAFDNGHVTTPFPFIETAGYENTIFVGTGPADAPMISLTNGTASSGFGQFWQGGGIGSFQVTSLSADVTKSQRHALRLLGVFGMRFGYIYGQDLDGAVLNIPPKLYGGSNPDPYSVSSCIFEGLRGDRCRRVCDNQNYLGLNASDVSIVVGYKCTEGVLRDLGAGMRYGNISGGSNRGWFIDDNTYAAAPVSSAHAVDIGTMEIDDSENGVRINRLRQCRIKNTRFIHRRNGSSLNVSGQYWPRTALKLAGGSSPSINDLEFQIEHRIDPGGVLGDLGQFVDFSSDAGNIVNVTIEQLIQDNAGLGIADSRTYTNFNSNTQAVMRRAGKVILDTRPKRMSIASYTTSLTVKNSAAGLVDPTRILNFANERFDPSGDYDPTTYGFMVPYTGQAEITITVPIQLTSGGIFEMGVLLLRSAAYSIATMRRFYAPNALINSYSLTQVITVQAGDVLYASARTGEAGDTAVTGILSPEDVIFSVRML